MKFPPRNCADMGGRRWFYLTALLAGVVFFTCYQEWFSWVTLLLLLGLPVFSLLVSLPAMLSFRVESQAPAAVEQGVETPADLTGWCRLPVPPFRGRVQVTRLCTGEQWRQKSGALLPTEHCGGLAVDPTGTRVYDCLGLIGLPARRRSGTVVLVRPKPLRLPDLPDLEQHLAWAWKPKPGGGYAENHEIRLYRPGDSLNQVHWKLSAKTGDLMIREAMEPQRGQILLTLNLRGTPAELDRKFGRLLWLGQYLLERNASFRLCCLTGDGIQTREIASGDELSKAVDALLVSPPASAGDLRERPYRASWRYHIGGEPDEA